MGLTSFFVVYHSELGGCVGVRCGCVFECYSGLRVAFVNPECNQAESRI